MFASVAPIARRVSSVRDCLKMTLVCTGGTGEEKGEKILCSIFAPPPDFALFPLSDNRRHLILKLISARTHAARMLDCVRSSACVVVRLQKYSFSFSSTAYFTQELRV